MDIGIGAIIFIVFIVISIAQKIKERADMARARHQQPQSKPGEMSAEARRKNYGEEAAVREATPRGVPHRRKPVAPARELMEALFGAERVEVVEEEADAEADAEWTPLTPDARRELPQRVPPPPPPIRRPVVARHIESRVQHEPVHKGATTREESIRLRQAQEARQRQGEEQQRARETSSDQPRGREEGPRRRRARQVQPTPPTRRQKRERMFSGAHEVRKAIVFAEILGPPKAFQDR